MEIVIYLLIIFASGTVAWLIATALAKSKSIPQKEHAELLQKQQSTHDELLLAENNLRFTYDKLNELNKLIEKNREDINLYLSEIKGKDQTIAVKSAGLTLNDQIIDQLNQQIEQLKSQLNQKNDEVSALNKQTAVVTANFNALKEKLEAQQAEMDLLRKQFSNEFELMANKILEEKTEKFTRLNHENLSAVLKPLGENIDSFRKKVEEVYIIESKERFSLGEEVKKLAQLNQKISEEAVNLTNALKGSSKTQGDWGEIILENILEKSGLVRGREYFTQEFLKNSDGVILTNELGNKMQPDVIIVYPDNRKVIIDSKVSLSAYLRFTQQDDPNEQNLSVREHLRSIRRHIDDLSRKNYQNYTDSLDFVMMFVPNEPAYLLALQHDPEIWQYAYDKKILLISPTNLIAALKLIADLWKREYQNRNAIEIADRGAKLYDKFVGFIQNLERIGKNLDQAQNAYQSAYKQLSTGNDNLVLQTQKLKDLGLKARKEIPANLLDTYE